jgi:hypothetical protein
MKINIIPFPKMANAMMLDEYHVSWNFNSSSRTLIPLSFGIISRVCLFPVNKHEGNINDKMATLMFSPMKRR